MFLELAALAAFAPQATQWPIGTEREVDEGVYMQVVASQSGWRIWKTETRSGVRCSAVKSAVGRPHPIPVGVGSAMFRGTPFLSLYLLDDDFSYYWSTTYIGKNRVKYRVPGARFWEEGAELNFDPSAVGEVRIEVVLTSWEYPEILVGYSEESAEFDLAGTGWAQEQVRQCQQPTSPGNDPLSTQAGE